MYLSLSLFFHCLSLPSCWSRVFIIPHIKIDKFLKISLFKKSSILVLGVVPLVTRSSTERCLGIDSDKHLLNLMFSFTIFSVDSHNAVFRTITVVGQCVLL